MNSNDPISERISRAFPSGDASPELRSRVMALRPQSRRSAGWYVAGTVGLAASAAAVVMLLLPTPALAQVILKRADSLQGHLRTYVILADGSRQPAGEAWVEGDKVRQEMVTDRAEFIIVTDPAKGFTAGWQPKSGRVTITTKDIGSRGANFWPATVTPDTLKQIVESRGWRLNPKVDRVAFEGRPADCVTLTGPQDVLTKIFSEPESHRIVGWRFSLPAANREALHNAKGYLVLVDDQKAPSGWFKPIFDVDGVRTDVVKKRAEWQSRFEKPIATYPVTKGTVAIRSLIVNPAGDVFVLYTGINGPYGKNVIPMVVTDANGGRYVKGDGFNASDGGTGYDPFVFDGKPLEGAWFVRVAGGAATGPISIGFKKQFEPMTNLAFQCRTDPDRISSDIPAYMPYMAMPIGSSEQWREERLLTLASYLTEADDFKGAERCYRQFIALTESPHRRSTMVAGANTYYQLGTAIEKQGRRGEALGVMLKAREAAKQWPTGGPVAGDIENAIRRLN